MRGTSDSNLNVLWRKTVLAVHGNKCFFCEADVNHYEIECHHWAAKRKIYLLRWDWRNGIPVCKWANDRGTQLSMSCHQFAETLQGRNMISDHMKIFHKYLYERNVSAKQWLVEHGMTKKDFKELMYKDLSVTWGICESYRKDGKKITSKKIDLFILNSMVGSLGALNA